LKQIVVLLSLLPLSAMAQSEEVGFISDRPGQINTTDVLPKGRLQLDTGVGYQDHSKGDEKKYFWTLNTTILHFGISDCAELRLQGNWKKEGGDQQDASGLEDVAVGTKVRLFDGWRFVPSVAMIGNVFIPNKHTEFMPKNWGGQMALIFQNDLTSWLSLCYEADLTWTDSERPDFFFGAALSFTLSDRWFLQLDEYNDDTEEGTESWLELSAGYQLSDRVQLDVGTGISLNYPNSMWNLSLGIAWQITKN